MAVNETIVTGRKFRKCIDASSKAWQRISFWTKSSDVEFEDGKNAETKLGAIDGITDSLENTSSRMAASAKAVSTLNNNLGGCQLSQEGNDFYIVGADSVRKKLGSGSAFIIPQLSSTISPYNSRTQGIYSIDWRFNVENYSQITINSMKASMNTTRILADNVTLLTFRENGTYNNLVYDITNYSTLKISGSVNMDFVGSRYITLTNIMFS